MNQDLTKDDIIILRKEKPELVEEASFLSYLLLKNLFYPDTEFCEKYNIDFYDRFNENNFVILING